MDGIFDEIMDPVGVQRRDAITRDRRDVVMRVEFDGLDLRDSERRFIQTILNQSPPSLSMVLSLDSELTEALRNKALVERCSLDLDDFAVRMRKLSPAQKLAIIEAFERGQLLTRQRGQTNSRAGDGLDGVPLPRFRAAIH